MGDVGGWIMTARCRDVGWVDNVDVFVKNEKTHRAMWKNTASRWNAMRTISDDDGFWDEKNILHIDDDCATHVSIWAV